MNQTRKKRVSKKTKRSWRKHVDSQDVEKFMDKVRQDERLGSFAHKKDSELFEIDTKPNENILPKSLKRCLLKSKEPKCFAILKPQSAVQDPITKRNRVRTKEERMNKLLLKKIEMRKRLGILKKKEITAMKDREAYEEKRKNKEQRGEFKEDVWRDREKEIFNDPEFVSDEAKRHTMIHLGERKRRSLIRKRTSVLPAIVSPHPGTSYNPSYEDHQKLLLEVAEKEKKLIKEEEHLERVTTKMFKKVSEEEKQSSYLTEMSEGLNLNNNNNDNTVNNNNDNNNNNDKVETENPKEEETSGRISVNPPVTREKKTKTQRRKQKEQKELLRQIKEKRIEKKKTSDIYKLKLIKKQMEKEDKKQNLNKEKKMKKLAEKDKQTKQLSKLKFEEPDMDFAMAEDITGNLRNTSTIGNLLKDRFLSMQQRNILAPSMMRTKPRGKVKRFIKPDHKIDVSEFNTNPQLRK